MSTVGQARSVLTIGTRGSQLALWQAEWVKQQLKSISPYLTIELKRIQTSGDKIQDVPLAKVGGKGLFVKEIEEALLRRDIDLAVHSMKDVPAVLPNGLAIICIPLREDPRDAWIARDGQHFDQFPSGGRVGTSSLRRQAQLFSIRPDLQIDMLRGNVDTRLRKLRENHFDAIVLAASGLKRLGWEDHITEYLPVDVSVPAIGQGALGIEGREEDDFVRDLVSRLEDPATRVTVTAERALLKRLEGGCQVPIAGHAVLKGTDLSLDGLVSSVDGKRYVRHSLRGSASEAESMGVQLAEELLARGAQPILQEIYGAA